MIKFAIPLAEGKVTAHFGHCQEFVLIEVENNGRGWVNTSKYVAEYLETRIRRVGIVPNRR